MKKKTNKVMVLVLFSLTIALSACGTKKLDGVYVGKINLLFTETPATLRFKGDKAIEVDDDVLTAELSDDKKSFTITSATGASELFLKDIKFTKEEK